MNTENLKKFFVDSLRDDGKWHRGSVGYPVADALALARELKEQHPTWLVEINAVEIT